MISRIFDPAPRPPVADLSPREYDAELIKYASNAFLAAKVSFINEIARLSERVGGDIRVVSTGMGLDPRIGPLFLEAGAGFSGPCLEKDLKSLIRQFAGAELDAMLLRAVLLINTVGSLSQEPILRRIMENVDAIYHLAAVVGVKPCVKDPVNVVEVNVCQTARLLEMAWQLGKKVIFTSTSEVYGKSAGVPFREDGDRRYGPSATDRWCYAVSKSAAEHLCFGYMRRGLPVVILRYFNVYGPCADSSDHGGGDFGLSPGGLA